MEKLDKIQEVKVGEQQTEIDPRSKNTANKSYNYIGTGGPEMEVQGQGAVLEEKKITSQFDNDPIAKLRARELDLRAMENDRKEREGKDRMDLDKMKAMMNQANQDEKLEQNEELAKLRANTSIEKTILSKTIPNVDSMMKNQGGMMPNVKIMRGGNE